MPLLVIVPLFQTLPRDPEVHVMCVHTASKQATNQFKADTDCLVTQLR